MKLKYLTSAAVLGVLFTSTLTCGHTAQAVTDSELATSKANKADALSQVNSLKATLEKYNGQVNELTAKRNALESTAAKLDQDIAKLNEDIAGRTKVLTEQARSAQLNQSQPLAYMSIIMDSKSLSDAITKVTAMKTIAKANKDLLDKQTSDKIDLESKSKAMQKNYGEYLRLTNDLDSKTKSILLQKAELEEASANYDLTIATGEHERAAAQAALDAASQKVTQIKTDESQQAKMQAQAAALERSQKEQARAVIADPNAAVSQQQAQTPAAQSPSDQAPVAAGNVFDYRNLFMTGGGGYNPYAGGGCTDYIWQYFAARGVFIPNVMPGNGKDWSYQMPRAPKLVPGVIASFTGGSHYSSPVYGHVAIVEEVYPDGSFKVSEGGGAYWGATRIIPNQSGVTFVLP